MRMQAQQIIDKHYVKCPHCANLVDLNKDDDVLVDAPNVPSLSFCSWKCLGRWVMEVYETGK